MKRSIHDISPGARSGIIMKSNFRLNQEDLYTLCVDRPLITNEIHKPNDYYGQASILKKYVGYPNHYPLKAVLEHGLFFHDWIWDADRCSRLPVYLSSSAHRAQIQTRETGTPSIPIGFGFLYAMVNYENIYGMEENLTCRKGTVVFPSHSTHHIKAIYDNEEYANRLNALPDKYKPITVCIYWKDFLHGYHSSYVKKGFRIVTAGHIYDPDFLYRFYDICRQFEYSTSNDIGGHLFYSVKSGCNFFYTLSNDINYEGHDGAPLGCFTEMSRKIKDRSVFLFSKPKDAMDREQLEFVDKYIGSAYLKTKEELRDLFQYAENKDKKWDKSMFLNHRKVSPLNMLPTFWQRKIYYIPTRVLGLGCKIKKSWLVKIVLL